MLKQTKLKLALAISGALLALGASSASAKTIGMGTNDWYTPTLENNLTSQGNTVSVFGSYDAATLNGLDVYIQDGNSYFNESLLEQFVFNGGTLIEVPWSLNWNYSFSNALNIMGGANDIIFGSTGSQVSVLDAASWLLNNVDIPDISNTAIGREIGNQFNVNATQVLAYSDGTAMLGYKQYGAGTVVGFNLHLITSDASPLDAKWSNQIVYNAVNHSGTNAVPEPTSIALLSMGALGFAASRRKKSA